MTATLYPIQEATLAIADRTLLALEFPKILEILASQTSFSASRALALALRPLHDLKAVAHLHDQTREAMRLREWKSNLSIGGASDVRRLAQDARIERVLEPGELLDIRGTLAAGRVLRATILNLKDKLPALWQLADGITPNQRLEHEIERCIGPRGEVMDAASALLGSIRAQIRVAHDRLLDRLNALVNSQTGQQVLQEPIITLRDGRYVVPLKAESKSQLRGIVHDTSASGATLFVEPLATVELNNSWRELQMEEGREVQRVLRRLTAEVGRFSIPLSTGVDRIADIDLILAKARFGENLRAASPKIVAADGGMVLRRARHPLLRGNVVPITVEIGNDFTILVITGPNTGGKTVALKTMGLLTLMAAAGLPIPADSGSQVPVFERVFADIGDEQSIEQSLSTFSSHMRNVISVLHEAGERSLVLLDELGAGTDPREGSALARAILGELLARRTVVVATTHHSELKAFAHLTPGVRNASVEFDLETLAPTYRLVVGAPGRSNALAIAARLGLPASVLEAARAELSPNESQVEDLLAGLQEERDALSDRRAALATLEAEQAALRDRLVITLDEAQQRRDRATDDAREALQQELEEARRLIRRATARAQQAHLPVAELMEVQEAIEQVRREVRAKKRATNRPAPQTARPLATGKAVLVRSMGQVGTLLTLPDERGEAEVQVGRLRVRARAGDLEATSGGAIEMRTPSFALRRGADVQPVEIELDLRGRRADEIGMALDQYLNDAYLAGLHSVRVIHGKGTGALRRVVREALAGHPLVREAAPAPSNQGGEGVTIAELLGTT